MTKRLTFMAAIAIACVLIIAAPRTSGAQQAKPDDAPNVLLSPWSAPFEMPPFGSIPVDDYIEAFDVTAKRQNEAIAAIVANPDPPTFENTIEAYERSRSDLYRVLRVFLPVSQSLRSDTINEVSAYIFPAFASHEEAIFLNREIFARVQEIYETRVDRDLDDDQIRLIEMIHQEFEKYGVGVADDLKARLEEVSTRIADLQQQFDTNASEEAEHFEYLVTDRKDLGGLADSLVESTRERAKARGHECECWSIGLSRSLFDQLLQSSPNRNLRKSVYEAMMGLGGNDNQWNNEDILNELLVLRAERAGILGNSNSANFAQYRTKYAMAESPSNVYPILESLWEPMLAVANSELKLIEEAMTEDGVDGPVEAWDWDYYAEKVRQSTFSVDSEQVRQYFDLENVLLGSFHLTGRLFNIKFLEKPDLPRWHEDQLVFEVQTKTGDHLGVLMMDLYAREGKRGGGWTDEIRVAESMDRRVSGIAAVNYNLTKPAMGAKTLLTLREGEIVLHELGHALQTILSTQRYVRLSGFNYLPRDGVEYPPQLLEYWFTVPSVLKSVGRHAKTGQSIPDDMVEDLVRAARFNQARQKLQVIMLSTTDLALHSLSRIDMALQEFRSGEKMNAVAYAEQIAEGFEAPSYIGKGYGLLNFRHIVSLGYDAQYYGYLWADVIAADAFSRFEEEGYFNEVAARDLKRLLFEAGANLPLLEGFKALRGREPAPSAFIRRLQYQ